MKVLREDYSYRPHAVFVGSDWGNLDYVRKLAGELGLTEQVHFKGFVPREELIALYRNAEALVYPSMFGPENLPPLEAFALGCPVVAARVSSAEQLGEAALIVDETDERAFAAALHDLRVNPDLRADLISKGRRRAAVFTAKDLAQAIFDMLDEFEPIRECWSQENRYDNKFRVSRLFSR
jgi:glycosyltransferase involved in cell wall biosynthesis